MAFIEITAQHDSPAFTPVEVPVPSGMPLPGHALQLRAEGSAEVIPVQRDGDTLVALMPGMASGQTRRYRLEGATAQPAGVRLREEGEYQLAIVLPEGVFTTYHFDPKLARPFFYPVYGPGGKAVTRHYPMKDVAGEERDHPHHRSFWTAYGEVNGVDDWSELKGHGLIRHVKFTDKKEGPAFGGFTAELRWTSADGKPLLDERRTIRVYNAGPERRLLDLNVELIARHGEVHYGDTKEGGLMAWRVATSMDGKHGGKMQNSNGGVGEREVWGKPATWLDYNGMVEGEHLGIAMMDHPGNLNHPCRWHARDYGLVGTNSFAKGSFEKGLPTDGYRQKQGETLRFRYRALIHPGDAASAKIGDAYHAWIQAPKGNLRR